MFRMQDERDPGEYARSRNACLGETRQWHSNTRVRWRYFKLRQAHLRCKKTTRGSDLWSKNLSFSLAGSRWGQCLNNQRGERIGQQNKLWKSQITFALPDARRALVPLAPITHSAGIGPGFSKNSGKQVGQFGHSGPGTVSIWAWDSFYLTKHEARSATHLSP